MSQHHLVVIVGLAILNGIFSPALIAVFALHPVWYPSFLPVIVPLLFLLSSLITATLTLMIGGVPAALYERLSGQSRSAVAGYVWLAGVLVLTLPSLPGIMKALGL
ncbi:hypothetical protein [Taklimakanibacter lacteus]|uniref:hypothetical protein n=1 Tax=Taklimakanibacter lacteus TaxID=2268456 RepID=UPI000E666041